MTAPAQRVALVTGASRGIGRAIALDLAGQGLAVALHARTRSDEVEAVRDAIISAGGSAVIAAADLARPDAPETLLAALDGELAAIGLPRTLHALVNNAGIAPWDAIDEVTEAGLEAVLRVNLKAPLFLVQQALPRLGDGGRIVNVSSTSVRNGTPTLAAYAPSKAALECLTLVLARQLGPRGITANAVRPGPTLTELNPATHDADRRRASEAQIALGRMGEARDVAAVVAFLVSDAGGWVTGQVIDASGGFRL